MGAGIAQVCAQSGLDVILYDMEQAALDKGTAVINKLLSRSEEKERITEEDKQTTLSRLHSTTSIQEAEKADLVIEAIVENMDVKTKLFKELDNIVSEQTILATNTSSLPITEIAASTKRPEKVIGMHFMNPVPVMKLVEVIRAIQTDDATFETIEQMAKKLNKVSVEVADFPGFAANRILMP